MSEERPVISTIRDDIDLNDQTLGLKIAAERLSIVRYVFLVQIEDGIASASGHRWNTPTPCSSAGRRPTPRTSWNWTR